MENQDILIRSFESRPKSKSHIKGLNLVPSESHKNHELTNKIKLCLRNRDEEARQNIFQYLAQQVVGRI